MTKLFNTATGHFNMFEITRQAHERISHFKGDSTYQQRFKMSHEVIMCQAQTEKANAARTQAEIEASKLLWKAELISRKSRLSFRDHHEIAMLKQRAEELKAA